MAKTNARKQIKEGAYALEDLMIESLGNISDAMIQSIMRRARNATPAQLPSIIKDIPSPGFNEYKAMLLESIGLLAEDAINQARKEVPKAKHVKLDSSFDKLPAELKRKLKLNATLLSDAQLEAMQKSISFAYLHNYETTDSMDLLEQDLYDGADEWFAGNAIQSGAQVTAGTTVNSARDTFFDDPEVSGNIEAFVFNNGDPVTEICQELEGTVFAKDDPDRFRYTPPLHWNCKSWIGIILTGDLGNKEIEKLDPSKKAKQSIQFDDALKEVIRAVTLG